MAKGQATETQVNLKINGESASNTLKAMGGDVRTLRKELAAIPVDTQQFIDKAKELSIAEDKLLAAKNAANEVRGQMRSLGDDTKKARADLLSLTPVGGMLNGLQQGFTSVRTAVGANITGMNLLKLAIASTGIGALVIALVALYQYFTKTDEGATQLQGAMKALELVTNRLSKGVQEFGRWMVAAFENPKQAMADVVEFLQNQLLNRIKSFGVILEGIVNLDFKKVIDGTVQLTTGVTDATSKMADLGKEIKAAAKAGNELAQMMDDLDEAESKAIVTNAKYEEQISRLLLQAKDRTKTEAERLLLLDRASALETQRLQDAIGLANQKLALTKKQYEESAKTGNQTDEQFRALKEAEAGVINLRKESIDLQEKISNRRNALLDAEAEKEKIMTEEKKKAKEDEAKAELEYLRRLTDLRIANIADEGERRQAQIEVDFKRQLEDAALKNQLKTDLELELRRQKEAQLDALETELADQKRQKIADAESIRLEGEKLAIDALVASEEEKEQRLYEVNRIGLQNRLALIIDQYGEQSTQAKKLANEIEKLDVDHYKKREELSQKSADFEDKITQKRLETLGDMFGGIADLLAQDEQARKENSEAIKLFATGEIIAMGFKEIAGIWSNANVHALNALIPGWGPAFAAVQTGLAVARTAAGVSRTQSAKFSRGGMLTPKGGHLSQGQTHENGGIQMFDGATGEHLGEAERGEFMMILSRDFYNNNKAAMDMALDASLYGGGKKVFRNGGFFEDGGMVEINRAPAQQAGQSDALMQKVAEQNSLLKSIDRKLSAPQRVQAYVIYEQQAAMISEAQQIEEEVNA